MIHIARVASKIKHTEYNLSMAAISALKGIQFYIFTPENVNYEQQTILGTYYNGEKWKQKVFPYPDYIYDRMLTRGRRHHKFYKAFQHIPFSNEKTPSGSLSKKQMYEAILKGDTFKDYLIPFEIIQSTETCVAYLYVHEKIICKPDVSSEGKNVFLFELKDGDIHLTINHQTIIYTKEQLIHYLNEEIFYRNKKYIVQPYIQSRTNSGNPFDIRVMIMKDKNGHWKTVKTYARIGHIDGVVSNVIAGGSTCDLGTFTNKHISLKNPIAFRKNIRRFALQFAQHIEQQFDFHFSEMGLDIAVDEQENLWLFEVNMNRVSIEPLIFKAAEQAINYGAFVAQKNYAISNGKDLNNARL